MRPVTRRQNILWHHQTDAGIIRGQRQKLHLKLHCICNHNAEWKQNHTYPISWKSQCWKDLSEVSSFESKLFIGWKSQISINQQYQLPPKHIMRKKSATSRIIGKLWRNFQQPNSGWTKDHIVINQLKAWNYWQYWRWISHNMKVSIDWSTDDMCAPSQPDLPIYSDYWQLKKWSLSQSIIHCWSDCDNRKQYRYWELLWHETYTMKKDQCC